jgi:prepilin-type N-terminal cleavage/methylation domain-containing protein
MINILQSFLRRKNFTKTNVRGFTLVELMVSIAIFTSVMVIATGALFSAQAVNTKLQQTQLILDGVNLAVEVISRDIRYGTTFDCEALIIPSPVPTGRKSCPYQNGGSVLILKPATPFPGSENPALDRIAYYLSNGSIYKDEYTAGLSDGGHKRTYRITPSDVNVETMTFFVRGAESSQGDPADLDQPVITFVVSGETIPFRSHAVPVSFNVQTSVSPRGTDN